MFDIGSSELLLIVIVAVVVIGPKDLPRVLYKLGQILGKGRAMTRHFRSGIDEMIRQAEMEEMEKKWAADNARIMAQTPVAEAVPPVADGASPSALSSPEPVAGFDPPEADAGHYAQADAGHYEVGPESESARPAETAPHSAEPRPVPKTEGGSAA